MTGHIVYAPIRKSADGYEFPDVSAISCAYVMARQLADQADRANPQWARANRVTRIARMALIPADEPAIIEEGRP